MKKEEKVKLLFPVWITHDYSLFKKLDQNRIVTEARVKKLIASIGEKAIDIPIVCNEKMEIEDGQGRYEARKRLGLPIPFIIIPGTDYDDCVRLNRYNTNWTASDWVDSWARNQDQSIAINYIRLKSCAQENKMSIPRIMRITGKSGATSTSEYFERGNLSFSEDDLATANDIIQKGKEIIEALCFTQRTNDAFWTAVRVAMRTKGYDHSKMVRNCKINRASYTQMAGIEAELKEFSRIYNYKTQAASNKRIYFEDYMRNRGYNVRSYEGQSPLEDVSTLK